MSKLARAIKRKCTDLDNIICNPNKKLKLMNQKSSFIEESIKANMNKMGYKEFRRNQQHIVMDIINGKNTFISMSTGSGKSLCFQLSILVNKDMYINRISNENSISTSLKFPIGIVISPLIALMTDQVNKLKSKNISARYYNSSISDKDKDEIKTRIQFGYLDILYITPESLFSKNSDIQVYLKAYSHVTTFVIDEAHCVIMWGSSFRPTYFKLNDIINELGNPTIVACTATVSNIMRNTIINNLRINTENTSVHTYTANRPNIEINIQTVMNERQSFKKAVSIITEISKKYDLSTTSNCIIVYGGMIKTTQKFYEYCKNECELDVTPAIYHSKLKRYERDACLRDFMNGKKNVIVCTSGFGMGIDKPNVRCVIHLMLPPNMEEYYQQIGRCGRDGNQSHAYLMTYPDDHFAKCVVARSDITSIENVGNHLIGMYKRKIGKNIGRQSKLFEEMHGIQIDPNDTDKMTFEEYKSYLQFKHAIKILARYGILQCNGCWVYLKSTNLNKLDYDEIKKTDQENEFSYLKIRDIFQENGCLRKYVLKYFDDNEYIQDPNYPCCCVCEKLDINRIK